MPQMSLGPSALTARALSAPETTDHFFPSQCRTTKSANAQAFVGLKSRTALRGPSLGPATTDQAVPFQFSATGAALALEGPPTAQASVSERAYDPPSSAPAVPAGGVITVQ